MMGGSTRPNGAAEREHLARTASARSSLYGLLADGYRRTPTAELLAGFREPRLRELLADAGVTLPAVRSEGPEAASVEDLGREYTRLFIGPGKHIAPYESVQAEGAGGAPWAPEPGEVKDFVEAAGLAARADYGGVPDHVSVELDFMREITGREGLAWQWQDAATIFGFLDIERRFLNNHLGAWIFSFCNRVAYAAELAFYRDLARLTAAFLAAEVEEVERRLDIAIGTESHPRP